jgi:DNA polymerase-3 subunit gamma/tau
MFATTDPEKVLPTILSRCQRFDLRRIPSALIVKHLAHIAKLEKVAINDPALLAIARGADGGMRDAESTLDQLISFCGDKIEEADVLSMFGLAAQSQVLGLTQAVLTGEIQTALGLLNELAQNGKDLGRLLGDLLNHFRNLLIFQVSRGDLNLLEVSETEVVALKEQSPLANTGSLTRILEVLTDAELRLRDTASKKILIEVTMLKAIEAGSAVSLDSVLKQLNQLRGGQSSVGTPVAPKHGEAAVSAERRPPVRREPEHTQQRAVPKAGAPVPAPAPSADVPPVSADLGELWTKLIEAVGRVSPFTRSYLVDANPVSFAQGILTIGFDPEFEDHLGLVDNARNHTLLQTKLTELGHANCQIKFIKAEAPAVRLPQPARMAPPEPTASPAPAAQKPVEGGAAKPAAAAPAKEKTAPVAFNKNDFKNDPLIQKALEIFKGQIIEVRA